MDTGIFKGMLLIGSKGHHASTKPPPRDDPMPVTKKEMVKPPAVSIVGGEPAKKKGRPNMKEAKRQVRKAQMSALDMFIESKPTKAKVREYFETRVAQLKEAE